MVLHLQPIRPETSSVLPSLLRYCLSCIENAENWSRTAKNLIVFRSFLVYRLVVDRDRRCFGCQIREKFAIALGVEKNLHIAAWKVDCPL